jgi:hypothetical protein
LFFGCSIEALRQLAKQRGYTFVGSNSNGINAFFVRNDLAEPVLAKLDDTRAFASRHRDSRNADGQMSYAGGLARFELIRHLDVVDVSNGQRVRLAEIKQPYSEQWLQEMH